MTPRLIYRFAPSPNGYLHLGHALSALLNDRAARETNGRFLLRIEDIDLGRARAEFEAAIYEDLGWLGLAWEMPVMRQSERFDVYRGVLGELERLGLLYPAFMSRRHIQDALADTGDDWPRDPDNAPHYPGTEREWPEAKRRAEMASGRPYALRIDMARAIDGLPQLGWCEKNPFDDAPPRQAEANLAAWGDVVIARSDCPASYHLCVVVDDAEQAVSHVIRGADLAASTAIHRLLQHLLGLPEPLYFHHRLIPDDSGAKLSKSAGSKSLRNLRAEGLAPADILQALEPLLRAPA